MIHLAGLALLALQQPEAPPPAAEPAPLTTSELAAAAAVAGLSFTEAELAMMLSEAVDFRAGYLRMQQRPLPNPVHPALGFSPLLPGMELRAAPQPAWDGALPRAERPAELEELAFADIATLASLIRSRQVSCLELTEMFLARLQRIDAELHCVVTLTAVRARAQAAALDLELAAGEWRGPLHGIPYGAKDLLAVAGAPTTWGAKPFEHQVLDQDATVIRRLDQAGAVLIAKLSLGALAMGDVWFGGRTRNPWKPEQGSSGSSAGSAAATAAGGVVFALGSETLGSIVSPSSRCGNSSLRPTFGRVGRGGAMALSWSMDKLGPLCRSAADAALVFDALHGADGADPDAVDRPYAVPAPVDPAGWRVGYPAGAFDEDAPGRRVLDELEALGVELVPVAVPEFPVWEMMVILQAEAATAFDELTRDDRDDLLTRQGPDAWPNSFRSARLIPAVEYLRANRLRTQLMREFDAALAGVDLMVHPSFGSLLGVTNLTGHPCVVAPSGFRDDGTPRSISFTGQLYDEARLLALVRAWQESTGYHNRRPAAFAPGPGAGRRP
ncbi:MAG: amidase [Planctomycetes bacterium]|nr:amidase [Planctomycetota bacterium]